MRKKRLAVVLVSVSLLTFLLINTAWAGGNVNFMYGQKELDSDNWEPVESQREYGLMLDFKAQNWPISIAADLLFSEDDDYIGSIKVEGETREINLGVRKYFSVTDQFKPYIGGGIAWIKGEVSASLFGQSASEDDSNIGFWISGGAVYTVAQHFNIGLDLRYSDAEITIAGIDGEAGGTHVLAFAGFHF
ncbi:MAG: outer membrane beta-barrel protein [Desulfobacteraceae bacterium]|jgi:opacity protein-like surface antigen